jgi:hypothetical protein
VAKYSHTMRNVTELRLAIVKDQQARNERQKRNSKNGSAEERMARSRART